MTRMQPRRQRYCGGLPHLLHELRRVDLPIAVLVQRPHELSHVASPQRDVMLYKGLAQLRGVDAAAAVAVPVRTIIPGRDSWTNASPDVSKDRASYRLRKRSRTRSFLSSIMLKTLSNALARGCGCAEPSPDAAEEDGCGC